MAAAAGSGSGSAGDASGDKPGSAGGAGAGGDTTEKAAGASSSNTSSPSKKKKPLPGDDHVGRQERYQQDPINTYSPNISGNGYYNKNYSPAPVVNNMEAKDAKYSGFVDPKQGGNVPPQDRVPKRPGKLAETKVASDFRRGASPDPVQQAAVKPNKKASPSKKKAHDDAILASSPEDDRRANKKATDAKKAKEAEARQQSPLYKIDKVNDGSSTGTGSKPSTKEGVQGERKDRKKHGGDKNEHYKPHKVKTSEGEFGEKNLGKDYEKQQAAKAMPKEGSQNRAAPSGLGSKSSSKEQTAGVAAAAPAAATADKAAKVEEDAGYDDDDFEKEDAGYDDDDFEKDESSPAEDTGAAAAPAPAAVAPSPVPVEFKPPANYTESKDDDGGDDYGDEDFEEEDEVADHYQY